MRLTAKGEGMFLFSQRSLAGELQVRSTKRIMTGGMITVVIEQPFSAGTHVLIGIRPALTKFHHQTWFAFSTFDRTLLFSELMFGRLL